MQSDFQKIWKHETMCTKRPPNYIRKNTAPSIIEESYNTISNNSNLKLEIVKNYEKDGYFLSIIITSRLRIIQRLWRKYYSKRMKHFKNIKNILYREINGKYPSLS